jgi:hypothetical protein
MQTQGHEGFGRQQPIKDIVHTLRMLGLPCRKI